LFPCFKTHHDSHSGNPVNFGFLILRLWSGYYRRRIGHEYEEKNGVNVDNQV